MKPVRVQGFVRDHAGIDAARLRERFGSGFLLVRSVRSSAALAPPTGRTTDVAAVIEETRSQVQEAELHVLTQPGTPRAVTLGRADSADIQIPLGLVIDPIETTQVAIGGSLSSDAAIGDISRTSIQVIDSLGTSRIRSTPVRSVPVPTQAGSKWWGR